MATERPQPSAAWIIALACLPFVARGTAVAWFAHNYLAQSVYKLLQVGIPVGGDVGSVGKRGVQQPGQSTEPLPNVRTCLLAIAIAAVSVTMAALILPSLAAGWELRRPTCERTLTGHLTSPLRWQWVFRFFLTLVNSGIEELHYRAWLIGSCQIVMAGRSGSARAQRPSPECTLSSLQD